MSLNTNNIGSPSFGNSGLPLNAGTQAIKAKRAPSSQDKAYPYGQVWIDLLNEDVYILSGVSANVATWQLLASGAGAITSVLGTSNQVSVASASGVATVSLPSAISAPGSLTVATDITATLGNVVINGAAKQLRVHGGAATDFIGQATLALGTVTVLNTNIAAGDKIMVSRRGINGSSALGVFNTSISAATSFTITALKPADATTETGDTSIVDYFIVRQV